MTTKSFDFIIEKLEKSLKEKHYVHRYHAYMTISDELRDTLLWILGIRFGHEEFETFTDFQKNAYKYLTKSIKECGNHFKEELQTMKIIFPEACDSIDTEEMLAGLECIYLESFITCDDDNILKL